LRHLDPDLGYDDWLRVIMAMFTETGGSEEGFEIVLNWSSKGHKFKGENDVRKVWKHLRVDIDRPVTMGTLIKMVNDAGGDAMAIMMMAEFETCEITVTAR
jgi:hypothetical protein